MSTQKRIAVLSGVLGLILIALGIKYMPVFLAIAETPVSTDSKSVIYFFSLDDPCDCMVELTRNAEKQMADWPLDRQFGIQVIRIPMELRKDLEVKYKVFRAPCLVLVDEEDHVVWRQDYPLIEAGPFKLEELEAAISALLGMD